MAHPLKTNRTYPVSGWEARRGGAPDLGRIWVRLLREKPEWRLGESTVRQYVQRRKRELGLASRRPLFHRACCWRREDEERVIAGRTQTVGAALAIEREHLLPLAEEGFDLAAVSFPVVNSSGCVNVRTNFYSVPLPVGTRVEAKVQAAYVEAEDRGRSALRAAMRRPAKLESPVFSTS